MQQFPDQVSSSSNSYWGTETSERFETTLEHAKRNSLKELTVNDVDILQSDFLRDYNIQLETVIATQECSENFSKVCTVQKESNNSIFEQCKDAMDWIVGIVEFKVDPKVTFSIKMRDYTPYPPCDSEDVGEVTKKEQANDYEMNLFASDESEDDDEMFGVRKKSELLSRTAGVSIFSQCQYDILVKLRDNKLLIVDKNWPRFEKYRKDAVLISRAGDGYEHSVLLQGFSPPITRSQDFPPSDVVPECEKLHLLELYGEHRAGIKDREQYQSMLSPEKLKHLFKCMDKSCSFTGDSKSDFLRHLISHGIKWKIENKVAKYSERNWICCSYCSLQYKKAEDLCDHIVHQHSKSLYQCGHCFYRCFCESYINKHYVERHQIEVPKIILCEVVVDSNYIESVGVKLCAYSCSRDCCSDSSLQFLLRNEFMDHLKSCTPPGSFCACHICNATYKDHRHLVDHYKCHSIFRYQCFYCFYGSEDFYNMENHVFEVHPNLSGKIFDRQKETKGEVIIQKSDSCPINIISKNEEDKKREPNLDTSNESSSQFSGCETVDEKERRLNGLEGTSLYRCGNAKCNFSAPNAVHYKYHIVVCEHMPKSKLFSCYHCSKQVKCIYKLMDHVKTHGKKRRNCSLCTFKCCINNDLGKHFKSVHRISTYRVSKSQEDIDEPEATIYPKEPSCQLVLPATLQENFMLLSNKARFLPVDIDKIPTTNIFKYFVGCGLCTFTTKIRTNILRHLKLHSQSDLDGGKTVVPKTDPVNPVPYLERNELMYDKTENWAESSYKNKLESEVSKKDTEMKTQKEKWPITKNYTDRNYSIRIFCAEENARNDTESWRCTLCAYKVHFSSWEEAKIHCTEYHNVLGQFVCSSCSFSSDYVFEITAHVNKNQCKHPSQKGRIIITFCRNEALAALAKVKEETSNIWKRAAPVVKQIRGIYLENCEASNSMPVKSKNSLAPLVAPPKCIADVQGNLSEESASLSSIIAPLKPEQKILTNSSILNASTNSPLPSNDSTPADEVKHYVCMECNKYKTKNVPNLIIHLYNEFNYRRYKCKLCDHKFITENSLKGHMVGDHQIFYNFSLCELLPADENIEDYVSKCIKDQQ